MSLFSDVSSVFIDDYQDGVRDTSSKPVIFTDPNDFDLTLKDIIKSNVKREDVAKGQFKISPKDRETMREMLEDQHPGITSGQTNREIEIMVYQSVKRGPFADIFMKDGVEVCIVNELLEEIDHKNEFMPHIAATSLEKLGVIPGWNDHWQRAIGIHEGEHCNQIFPDVSKMSEADIDIHVLNMEAGSDIKAIKWLKENGHPEIAQALHDYRALGANRDPTHATSIFLENEGGNIQVWPEHIDAARSFKGAMVNGVASTLGISKQDARQLFDDNPEKFIETARQNLADGVHNGNNTNPHIATYIEDYIGAYQRQILDPDPVGPRPTNKTDPHYSPVNMSSASDDLLEGRVEYIAAATTLERERSGEELDPIEERDLKQILGDPQTDPQIMGILESRYAGVMDKFIDKPQTDPAPNPEMASNHAMTTAPQAMQPNAIEKGLTPDFK